MTTPTILSNPIFLKTKQNIPPTQFIWAKQDLTQTQEDLNEPVLDLAGFYNGNTESTLNTAKLLHDACINHGFFQVTNHGVEQWLVSAAHDQLDGLFKLSNEKKMSLKRKPGSVWGYSGAHCDHYSSKLPWKETFSFKYEYASSEEMVVLDYFNSVMEGQLEEAGMVYQLYCESMKKLSLAIFELLAISLGVEKEEFKKFFEDGSSIVRCDNYPRCDQPGLTLGTGPHTDPTALTILHQDQVGGLEVFVNSKWQSVRPRPDALVINIGHTFKFYKGLYANGRYKSCVVNKEKERKSLVFLVCPKDDKVVRAGESVVERNGGKRMYPDFKWSELYKFTQNHYRAYESTLLAFFSWLLSPASTTTYST